MNLTLHWGVSKIWRLVTQAFFFTVAEKLKAKKTQATKKLKHLFSQKLNVPEDFSKILAKNSIFALFFG